MKKLTENLKSKDRLTRVLARMQLIRLGRYEDERQELGGGMRSGLTPQRADGGPISRRHSGRGRSQARGLHAPLDQAPGDSTDKNR